MAADDIDPVQLATALHQLNELANRLAPAETSPVLDFLAGHLSTPPGDAPIVTDDHPQIERPNIQLALDAWTAAPGRAVRAVGLAIPNRGHMEFGLAEIVAPAWGPPAKPGPLTFVEAGSGPGSSISCLTNALLLLDDGEARLVALLGSTPDMGMRTSQLRIEVMTDSAARGAAFLAEIRRLAIEHSVYRGQVVSLAGTDLRGPAPTVAVRFHERSDVERSAVVLADGVLDRIERHAIGIADRADQLRAAGRDLKRGLLLFGPPGTGKTLTVRYLAARQPDRTVVLVAGADVGSIAAACRLARSLAPATVVLEDVDLVAEERTMFGHGQNPMLAALLNEMDQVDDDSDVVFLLTTNRADLLEPALATRPGRVDQAVEIALPDASCRARLVDLYAGSLVLDDAQRTELVARLDGVSAAFVKELMRRAEVRATLADQSLTHAHVLAALDELFADSSALTRTLLGAAQPDPGPLANVPRGLTIPAGVHQMIIGTSG